MKTNLFTMNHLFIICFLSILWLGYSCKPPDSKNLVKNHVARNIDTTQHEPQIKIESIIKNGIPTWAGPSEESIPNYYSGRIIDNSDISTSVKKTRSDNTYEQLIEMEMVMGKSAPFTTKTFGLPVGVKELGLPTLY